MPSPDLLLTPASPALRLIAVPGGWPPYDCESHGAACPAARDTADRVQGPGDPLAAPRRLTVGSGRPEAPPPAAGLPPATDLPPAAVLQAAWPQQLAQVMVEILAGRRPVRQVVPLTTERTRAQIRRLAAALSSDRQPRIRRVRTSRPVDRVMEIAVVASFGPRTRALAMRFEHVAAREAAPGRPARPARWLCTEIEGA